MSKNELRSSGERRSAVHDNRMFAKRAFYCIANGAGERPGEGHCGTDYKHIYQLCWC